MNIQQFGSEMQRLKNTYNTGTINKYPKEREEQIWAWAKNIDANIFNSIISKLIVEQTNAPMMKEFKEVHYALKGSYQSSYVASKCVYCDGSGFILDGSPMPTAYACRCPTGEEIPSYVKRWTGQLTRTVPTHAELNWRNVPSVITGALKKIEVPE